MTSVDREVIAAAAQRNVQVLRKAEPSRVLYTPHDAEHDLRQAFRKRISLEVLEKNSREIAIKSLQAVKTLAENILSEPTNPRWRRFRTSNDSIRRLILQPGGVLQLVVDLGFREKTEDFVTYYVFNGSKSANNRLRVGTSMIKEAIESERQKLEDEERRLAQEESERKAHVQRIHLQIHDDRLSVAARAQRERHSGYKEKGIPGRKGIPAKGTIATLHGEA